MKVPVSFVTLLGPLLLASTYLTQASLHGLSKLQARDPSRRVYVEVDRKLAYAMIQDYDDSKPGPLTIAIHLERLDAASPAIKLHIRVQDYAYGVTLPTPYATEFSFPGQRYDENVAYIPHGLGVELYPVGRTTLSNKDIFDMRTGRGVLLDELAALPAVHNNYDPNEHTLLVLSALQLNTHGYRGDLGRVLDFVTKGSEWYLSKGVDYYCEMPLMVYHGRYDKRTFNIEDKNHPQLLSESAVADFIRSIAPRITSQNLEASTL
ncbi:hypothetical protein MMC13_000374 [Lambiella insularis]|nr:hypothetical protein [Lambiella insularis]